MKVPKTWGRSRDRSPSRRWEMVGCGFPPHFRGEFGSCWNWDWSKNLHPLVFPNIPGGWISPFSIGNTSTPSGAPIFQPAMLDYQNVGCLYLDIACQVGFSARQKDSSMSRFARFTKLVLEMPWGLGAKVKIKNGGWISMNIYFFFFF